MNSYKNKLDGAKNQAIGAAKETVGKVLGDKDLQAKGAIDRLKGQLQSAEGNIKEAVISASNKIKSALTEK